MAWDPLDAAAEDWAPSPRDPVFQKAPVGAGLSQSQRARALALWEAELCQRERKLRGGDVCPTVPSGSSGAVGSGAVGSGAVGSVEESLRDVVRCVEGLVQQGGLKEAVGALRAEVSALAAAARGAAEREAAMRVTVEQMREEIAAGETRLRAREQELDRRDRAVREKELALAERSGAEKALRSLFESLSSGGCTSIQIPVHDSSPPASPPGHSEGMAVAARLAVDMPQSSPQASPTRVSRRGDHASPKYAEGRTGEDPARVVSYVTEISDSGSGTPPPAGVRTREGVVDIERWQELLRATMEDADGWLEEDEEEDEEDEE
eukprot:Hpha_TRINITY_DN15315_c3_g2::TRINITY_DN15315_c3_g2_i1::g.91350::m.91350